MRLPTPLLRYQKRVDQLYASPLVRFGHRWLRHALEAQIMDRSMGLAAQFFASLIPLLLVIAALAPVRTDSHFWNALARWLGLHGASQQTIQEIVGRGGELSVNTTWISGLILLISAFSFIRALQRVFEHIWTLKPLNFKNAPRQVVWLLLFLGCLWTGYLVRTLSLRIEPATPLLTALYFLVDLGVWWLTPYLLLGGRVGLRTLLPGAVASWAALVFYFVGSSFYMPGRINASATQYGPIGLIFAILSWYFILFCIVIAGSSLGPVLVDQDYSLAHLMRHEDQPTDEENTTGSAKPRRR